MRVAVHVAGAKDETSPQLKRILSQLVLMMTCGPHAFSARGVITAKKMQKVCGPESGGTVGAALFVDQQGKRDAGFLAEHACIMTVPQSDGGQGGSLVTEGLLAFAQLRDVLAAENSSIVAKEDDYGWGSGPQRAESNFAPVGIGERNLCECGAERWLHDGSILVMAALTVKRRKHCCRMSAVTEFYRSRGSDFISSSPSQRAITAQARQLPVTLTAVRTMSMSASIPRITKIGSVGR
jgi:hypothetical protein